MRTVRSQADSPEEMASWSDESGLACPPGEDRTRQEFKDEADVNVILRRVGAGGFEPRPMVYGVQDTDADLQTIYAAAAVAQDGWLKLPEHLRRRYPGWPELLAAVDRGEASLVDPDGVVSEPPKDLVPPVSS